MDYGFYKNGNLEGLGRLTLHNGDIYDGYLKEGKMQGKGIFYKKNTNCHIYGVFNNGKCTNLIKKGDNFPMETIGIFSLIFYINLHFLEIIRLDHHMKN